MTTIFFDATPLARWMQSTAHRVGIGRVAVNVLKEFLARSDVRVILLCPVGGQYDVSAFRELHPWAKNALFPYPRGQRPSRWKKKIKAGLLRLVHMLPSRAHALLKRVAQPRPYRVYERDMPDIRSLISQFLPSDRALYFSAFDPIPVAVQAFPEVERHVFLHDIIPLRVPDKHYGAHFTLQLSLAHIARATTIWCNSEFTKKDFLSYFPDTDPSLLRVSLLGGGEYFQPTSSDAVAHAREICGIPPGVPFVFSLATLEPRKGMVYVVGAFALALERSNMSDVHLVLGGQSGWAYKSIFAAARSVEGRVLTPGFLQDEVIAALLTDCACFVYLSEYEGFGLPVVEAMACGAPVVAADATSIPEVAGDAALLVPPRDVECAARAISLACFDSDVAARLRAAGPLRARTFTWERCVNTMLDH